MSDIKIRVLALAIFAYAALAACGKSGSVDLPPSEPDQTEEGNGNGNEEGNKPEEGDSTVLFNENIYTDPSPAGVSQYRLDNPNAIPNATNLYNYLVDLSKRSAAADKLIIGYYIGATYRSDVQQNYPFSLTEPAEIRRRSGKWVGMLDAWICPGVYPDNKFWDPFDDCMWYAQIVADYRLWWLNGGICHAGASPYCPSFSGHKFASAGQYGQRLKDDNSGYKNLDYNKLITAGTDENGRWHKLLDHIATFFLELQKYGIPVIYRPFTESYINNYWYSSCPWGDRTNPANAWPMTNAQFIALWRDTHNYLTAVKGCNNIIWDFQCRDHTDTHYPGDSYVDLLAGKSDYVHWPADEFYCPGDLNPGDMPVGNGELGCYGVSEDVASDTPDRVGKYSWESYVQTISQSAPRMVFCSVWDRKFGPVKYPAVTSGSFSYPDYDAGFDAAINHPYALTRERLNVTPAPPQLPFRMVFSDDRPMPVTYLGSWQYENNTLVRKDASNRSVAVYGNTDWTDYTAAATITVPATGEAGLIGRCASVIEYYSLSVGGGRLKLCKYVNYKNNAVYTPITLASAAFTPPNGADVQLFISFQGAAITATAVVGDTLPVSLTATDDGIASGCIGVFAQSTTVICRSLLAK